jgi:hypothetical protein
MQEKINAADAAKIIAASTVSTTLSSATPMVIDATGDASSSTTTTSNNATVPMSGSSSSTASTTAPTKVESDGFPDEIDSLPELKDDPEPIVAEHKVGPASRVCKLTTWHVTFPLHHWLLLTYYLRGYVMTTLCDNSE